MRKLTAPVLVSVATLAGLIVALAFHATRHLDAKAAYAGLSPEQVAMLTNRPELFVGDFPSGALELLSSVLYAVYPALHALGIDVTAAWSVMIVLEIVVYLGAVLLFAVWVFDIRDPVFLAVTGLVMGAGTLLAPDLSRFHFPYYGWIYAFAYAGVLIAIAAMLTDRFRLSALAVTTTFLVHPINAIFAGVFCLAVLGMRLRGGAHYSPAAFIVPTLITVAGCGAWTLYLSSGTSLTEGSLSAETYIAFVRGQNYHWFPSYLGIYWENHAQHLFPLLSTLALLGWAVGAQPPTPPKVVSALVAGILTMLVLCGAGLLIAEAATSPFLVKLSLIRADTVALLAGAYLILRALWRDLMEGDAIERGLAATLLVLPLVADHGLAPLPVALRVGYALVAVRRNGMPPGLWAALGLLAILAGLFGIYLAAGLVMPWQAPAYTGLDGGLALAAPVAGLIAAFRPASLSGLQPTALLAGMLLVSVLEARRFDTLSHPVALDQAEATLNAQLWARENTPEGALFMVDPGLFYTWRDKSHRPSFGTVREWLLASIIYNTKAEIFEEGLARYQALGLEYPDYLHDPGNTRMTPLLNRLIGDAMQRYYTFSEEDFRGLAHDYGIDFFVFRTDKLTGPVPLTEVYRNSHFMIATLDKQGRSRP
jgi:hypothetical protein